MKCYKNSKMDVYLDDEVDVNQKILELLKLKVKLDNGQEGYVFTKNTGDHPKGRYQCHVCNVLLGSGKTFFEHITGKNHTRKMEANFHPHENFTKVFNKEPRLCTDVGGKVIKAPGVDIPDLAPGEPVPPGFEDIVTRVPEISSTLEEMKAPLIGLEYLAEITPVGDEVEPKYCCLLCNKRGDPRTVLAHLVCFNHRIKYIGRYFPKVNTALALIPKVKEYKRGTGEVLAKIVKAIEIKFGRLNPVIVDGAIFEERKEEYYREMRAGRHFYETADSKYEMLVDLDFVKKCAPEADSVLTIDMEKEEAKKKSTEMKKNDESVKNKRKNTFQDQECDRKTGEKRPPPRNSNSNLNREKSIETISLSRSPSYSLSRSRSRSFIRSRSRSRSRSKSRSRSGSFSKFHSRVRPNYSYKYRDYHQGDQRRSRSPRYYYRSRSRSRSRPRPRSRSQSRSLSRTHSRSRSRGPSYRRYRSSGYRSKSPGFVRSTFRTIRYDSLYNDDDHYSPSDKPKSTQVKVAELRDKRRKRDLYADFVEKLEKDMAKTMKGYKKNPEKHPMYPEEWKKFWSRRYRELTAEGVDASKHDFKPEWIKFWLVRMKELHNEELEKKKEKYRMELGLSELEKSSGIDSDALEVSPVSLEDDKSNVTVEDIKTTWKVLTGSEIKSAKANTPERFESDEVQLEQPPRVITVLRLLTALEGQLGSLGPRVNNLLSQAIALEKKKINSSDTLIEISENNVLFETVKEKLKGQLFAGIVEKNMVNATRTAIQSVAELFNTWKTRKNAEAAPVPVAVQSTSEPLIVPGIGAVDKVLIAQQIATALIAQGKINVTEQELEQLINAVIGTAQATSRPVPTSPVPSTISKLSVSPSSFSPLQNEETPAGRSHLVSSVSKFYENGSSSGIKKWKLPQNMKDLSEEDLKMLLQNFKELLVEEQQSLIAYLKELESKDPSSVEKLRKFVGGSGDWFGKNENKGREESQANDRLSPFSMREGGANPFIDDGSKINSKDLDQDDDDDYSYEEIYKAAEKKVSGRSIVEQMIEEQQKKVKLTQSQPSPKSDKRSSRDFALASSKASDDPEYVLSEAKVMIANIMGQLPSKYNSGATRNVPKAKPPDPVSHPLVETQSAYPEHTIYGSSNVNNIPNNVLNENFNEDVFGYSTDGFQNFSETYHSEQNPANNFVQNQMQQPAYGGYQHETSYNYEPWSDNYSQYPPQQQQQQQQHQQEPLMYNCPPPVINPNYNGSDSYQGPPSNDYNGPLYNAY